MRRDGEDGPRRFVRNWLRFDETRPVRARMLRNFVVLAAALLAASALLAVMSAVVRR